MEEFEAYQKHPELIAFLNGPNILAKQISKTRFNLRC